MFTVSKLARKLPASVGLALVGCDVLTLGAHVAILGSRDGGRRKSVPCFSGSASHVR